MSLALEHGEATIHHHSLLHAFQSLLYILVVALFIMTFTAQPFRIPSASMEPTLLVGDFLLVNKEISTGRFPALAPANLIRHGDIIVFHYPVDPALHLVKRVIGLPGDRLRLRDGRVLIDGPARGSRRPHGRFALVGADALAGQKWRTDHPARQLLCARRQP
jgi:signal peptidase I